MHGKLALWLALHIFAKQCMSPKKGETAVHCCDPALSVLVVLVSRNVFHVVSALQSIVFLIKGLVSLACKHLPFFPFTIFTNTVLDLTRSDPYRQLIFVIYTCLLGFSELKYALYLPTGSW